MIIYIENHITGYRTHFKINSLEDFSNLEDEFPVAKYILLNSESLTDACEKLAQYLSNSYITAWVEPSNVLSKSVFNKIVSAGIAGAFFLGSPHHGSNLPQQKDPAKAHQFSDEMNAFGKMPEDAFLYAIMQNESSGGKNTGHKVIKHGKYKGEKAIGRWGLLKPTIDEIIVRLTRAKKNTPDIDVIRTMNRDETEKYLKNNPHIELKLARFLASHVIKNQKGDLLRAAYAWSYGHNLKPSDIPDRDLKNNDYIKKFKNEYRKYNLSDLYNIPKNKKGILISDVRKNEHDFKIKLKNWISERKELDLPSKNKFNENTDLGRLRDKKLDEKPFTDISNPIKYLYYKFKEARSGRKT